MNHCGGGPCTDLLDALAPLVDWVEHGRAPGKIIGAANPGSHGRGARGHFAIS
jgi:feruloyl esterase